MGDFWHMDTAAVSELMGRLADAGRDLESGWQSRLGAITGGEEFGGDAIADAIRGAYRPAGDALRELAARLPQAVMSDADVGTQSAADYLAAEERATAALSAVPGLGLGAGGTDARP
jgi:dihydroxyacetone kinase